MVLREGRADLFRNGLGKSRLDAEQIALDMDARAVHRRARVHAVVIEVVQRLQDRGAQAVRAARTDGDDAFLVHGEGGCHHGGDPHIGIPAVEATGIEVLLAQHVVQHDARAGQHVTRALAVGERQ